MISIETLSFYIMICVLAPLIGAFTILFLFIFEKRLEALESQANRLTLERELQQSKYDILSHKIQPHFFFNTLNVILGLARLDRKTELIRSVETLAKFMKRKYMMDDSVATIKEELTYTNYYLEIQKLRMGDRLVIKENIQSNVLPLMIPTYVIQTLTENCFKHSFEKYEGLAEITTSIMADEKNVQLVIWNSKHPQASTDSSQSSPDQREGIGLENIRERLHLLFPDSDATLKFMDEPEGTRVFMRWPVQYVSFKEESENEHPFN